MSSGLDLRLIHASEIGDSNSIRKLLRRQPLLDLNNRDSVGMCALSKAAKGGHFEVVKLLLEAQASPDTQNGCLTTPLHLAAQGSHSEVVKLLVLNGAKLDFTNVDGLKPIDLARYETETWDVLHAAAAGMMPEIEEVSEVPVIPDYAIAASTKPKKKKKGGKKGKKGSKKGKKKGKKK